MRITGAEYWLEPTTGIAGVAAGNQPHILFRRSAPLPSTRHRKKRKKKRKRKHEKNCGTRGEQIKSNKKRRLKWPESLLKANYSGKDNFSMLFALFTYTNISMYKLTDFFGMSTMFTS